jgi:23S rRNA (uracil1939-C5)-methyltransferase
MLTPGQQVQLAVEKPAAGGRMIGRHEGQIVFVLGAIPGERVLARVDRVERQLAFATAVDVLEPSADRREPFVDLLCGGCLYAHVAYPRQLEIKAEVVIDAFTRLGRITLPAFTVAPSPERGYRMRGRLFVQGAHAGFYREGTHTLCDAAATAQLRPSAVAIASAAVATLRERGVEVSAMAIAENIHGGQRALHAEVHPGTRVDEEVLGIAVRAHELSGISALTPAGIVTAGDPAVSDPMGVLTSGRASTGSLRRHAESFFQANRYLLPQLVSAVLDAVPPDGRLLDLYAGVGLFSIALAATGRGQITAVEGDRSSGRDLRENARQVRGAVDVVIGSVEDYVRVPRRPPPHTVIVDPPRTGISKPAMQAIAAMGPSRVVYVSCDPATMARDARRLVDAGFGLETFRAFDLFPNTPHVESLGVFSRPPAG